MAEHEPGGFFADTPKIPGMTPLTPPHEKADPVRWENARVLDRIFSNAVMLYRTLAPHMFVDASGKLMEADETMSKRAKRRMRKERLFMYQDSFNEVLRELFTNGVDETNSKKPPTIPKKTKFKFIESVGAIIHALTDSDSPITLEGLNALGELLSSIKFNDTSINKDTIIAEIHKDPEAKKVFEKYHYLFGEMKLPIKKRRTSINSSENTEQTLSEE